MANQHSLKKPISPQTTDGVLLYSIKKHQKQRGSCAKPSLTPGKSGIRMKRGGSLGSRGGHKVCLEGSRKGMCAMPKQERILESQVH